MKFRKLGQAHADMCRRLARDKEAKDRWRAIFGPFSDYDQDRRDAAEAHRAGFVDRVVRQTHYDPAVDGLFGGE